MDQPRSSSGIPEDGQRSTLRDVAHLYEAADELADRCRSGDAVHVIVEVDKPLAEAETAGVEDVVVRLRYIRGLANLLLGRWDDVVDACDRMLHTAPETADPAWMSVAHALRGLADLACGDHHAAVDEFTEATVLLDDARTTGQPFVTASHLLALGFLGLRLYELADETLERAAPLVTRPGFSVSRAVHTLSRMTVDLYWGLELDRLGQTSEGAAHFAAALTISEGAATLPTTNSRVWSQRMRARTGLARAMLGQPDAAIVDLEPTLHEISAAVLSEPPRVAVGVNDEVLVRLGLVRAYGVVERERALAEAGVAQKAAEQIGDPKLVLATTWEAVRLAAGAPTSESRAIVADYTERLEAERWQERVRFNRETRDRLQAQRERIRARQMSAEYLTDSATGVPNRRHLELRLPEFVDRARTHHEAVALAFVDLDAEAPISTLVAVGAMLRERAAPDGFVARYGGGEFVVITPRRTAKQLAELVAGVLEEQPRGETGPRPRVGVVSMTDPPSITGLFAAADEALLDARRAGGGIRLAANPNGWSGQGQR